MVEQFKADGVEFLLGTPESTEGGFLQALQSAETIKYVLALQAAIGSGQPTVVDMLTTTPTSEVKSASGAMDASAA